MAKIKPPAFNTRNSISGFVAWAELEQSGLLSLLELPRNEQVMIVQYKYPWFKPKGWVKPKDTKYTKKWWDSLTGDQQTVRWALAFSPVTPRGQGWAEPSLVRDRDGALLFSARGSGGERLSEVQVWRQQGGGPQWQLVVSTDDVRVWHKQAAGAEWGTVLRLPNAHNPGPISIGSAADATPYIAANRPGSGRETLCLWPLNAGRMDLAAPLTIRAARAEFGPAPGAGGWMVDHPSGAIVRLADGKWHGVVAYRVLASAEHKGAPPPPQSGCYVEEVISTGPVVPSWRFE